MKVKKIGNRLFGRVEKGEEILESLKKACEDYNILSGEITGIGAVGKLSVGHFMAKEKNYHSKEYEGDFEILSLAGNVSRMHGEVYLHIHVTVSDTDMRAFGGHLNFATVSATCEFIITDMGEEMDRFADDDSGLNVLKI